MFAWLMASCLISWINLIDMLGRGARPYLCGATFYIYVKYGGAEGWRAGVRLCTINPRTFCVGIGSGTSIRMGLASFLGEERMLG